MQGCVSNLSNIPLKRIYSSKRNFGKLWQSNYIRILTHFPYLPAIAVIAFKNGFWEKRYNMK